MLGLLQYLTPTLQLFCGVLVLGERMPPARWVGFGLVWIALVVLTVDTLHAARGRYLAAADAGREPSSDTAPAIAQPQGIRQAAGITDR
jgi:chloramphenicol-sensitive protein RarD